MQVNQLGNDMVFSLRKDDYITITFDRSDVDIQGHLLYDWGLEPKLEKVSDTGAPKTIQAPGSTTGVTVDIVKLFT